MDDVISNDIVVNDDDDISQQLLQEVLDSQYDDTNASIDELSFVTAESRDDSRMPTRMSSTRENNTRGSNKHNSRGISRGGDDDYYDEGSVPINEWNIDWPGNNDIFAGSSLGSLADASYASETEIASMSAALNEAEEGIVQLRKRLKKRVGIIAHIRNAYLKDVITLKHIINDVLTNNERQQVMNQYNAYLPSLDLRQYLELHGPKNSKLIVKPCVECGGYMEIMLDSGDTVRKLEAQLQYQKEKEEKLRIKIAEQDFLIEQEQKEKNVNIRSHNDEKRVLYNEIRKLKEEVENATTENIRVLKENKKMRDQVHIYKEENVTLVQGNEELKVTEESLKLEKEETFRLKNRVTAMQKLFDAKEAELSTQISENKNLQSINGALTQEIGLLKVDFATKTEEAQRFKKKSDELEDSLLVANNKIVETAEKLREAREDFENLEARSQKEATDFQKRIDISRDEISMLDGILKDKNVECITLRTDLDDSRKIITIKDRTIKERDNALMDAAAHHEALEEEISAMKQFLFDAVAAKTSTPMRRAGTADFDDEEDYDDDDDNADNADNETYTSETENVIGSVAGMADLFADGSTGSSVSRPSTSDQRPSTSDQRPSTSDQRPSTSDLKPSSASIESNTQSNTNSAAPSLTVNVDSPVTSSAGKKSPAAPVSASTTPKAAGRRASRLERTSVVDKRRKTRINAPIDGGQEDTQENDVIIESKPPTPGIDATLTEEKEDNVEQVSKPAAAARKATFVVPENVEVVTAKPSTIVQPTPSAAPRAAAAPSGAVKAKTQTGKPVKTPPANEKKSALGRSKPKPFIPPVEEIVELNPLRPDALPEEIMLRSALLAELTGSIGANKANKAINCSEKTIQAFGAKLNSTLSSLWEAMILDKKSLDFFVKIEKILAGILTCMAHVNPDDPDLKQVSITSANIALACAEIVPLAQSSVGTKLTAHWQEECQLDSHIVSALTPMVDFQTGNISYKSYNEFFGTDDHTQIERVEFAYEALKRMQSYADDSLLAVGEELVDVIKEWSDAKTVFVELDLIIEKEKGKVRTELTKQINSLKDDLSKQTTKTEICKNNIKNLESKIEDLEVRVNYLEPFPDKFNKSEKINEKKDKEIQDLKRSIDRLNGEVSKLKNHNANLTVNLDNTKDDLSKTKEQLLLITNNANRLDKELIIMTDLSNKRGIELEMLYEKERRRLECQIERDMQTDPVINNIGCQTEFINPPMTLRTVIATTYNSAGERQRFPVVTSKALENSYSHAEEKLLQRLARSNGFSYLNKMTKSLDGALVNDDRRYASDVSSLGDYEFLEGNSSSRIIEDYVEDINVKVSSPYLRAKSPPSDRVNDLASLELKTFRNRNANPEYTPNNKPISRYKKKVPALSPELLALHEKSITSSPFNKGVLRVGLASPLRLGTSGSVLSDVIEGSSVTSLR